MEERERERETEVWKVRQLLKTFNSRVECQFHGVISSKCISVVWWMCCFEMKWKWKRTNGKKKNTRIVKYLEVINIEIKEREFFPGELLVFYIY